MDEAQALEMLLDARKELHDISTGTLEIKDSLREIVQNHNEGIVADPAIDLGAEQSTEVQTLTALEYDVMNDLIHFNYAQTVSGIVICAVLMLMLGVQLFQTFNQHWR